jgi:Rieske Fe-S protein
LVNENDAPPLLHSALQPHRRTFLARLSSALMAFGLTAGYGMFATLIGWFLFPTRASARSWQFVIDLAGIESGRSLTYVSPAGQRVVITRTGNTGTAGDFIALSSVCPHLGCQVHWEVQNNRFFCPCHNGAFDPQGKAIAGPPFDAGQSLSRYPLMVENGLLFIEVDTQALV